MCIEKKKDTFADRRSKYQAAVSCVENCGLSEPYLVRFFGKPTRGSRPGEASPKMIEPSALNRPGYVNTHLDTCVIPHACPQLSTGSDQPKTKKNGPSPIQGRGPSNSHFQRRDPSAGRGPKRWDTGHWPALEGMCINKRES